MRSIVFGCILLFMNACVDSNKSQIKSVEESPMKAVMNIHDELMPKMGVIAQLQRQLKDTSIIDYQEASKKLSLANEGMMSWMEGIAKDFETDELLGRASLTPEKLKLLETYAIGIKVLKKETETAIDEAKQVLGTIRLD